MFCLPNGPNQAAITERQRRRPPLDPLGPCVSNRKGRPDHVILIDKAQNKLRRVASPLQCTSASQTIQLGNLFELALDFDAGDVPGVSFDEKAAPAIEAAKTFISDALADGPVPAAEVRQMAQQRNVKFGSLYKARKRSGILVSSGQWSLPR